MTENSKRFNPFFSIETEITAENLDSEARASEAAAFEKRINRLAIGDVKFMLREELRPMRLQLELMRPELIQQDLGIQSTIAIFGSARFNDTEKSAADLALAEKALAEKPDSSELKELVDKLKRLSKHSSNYNLARKLASLIATSKASVFQNTVIVTGGGPGIMEAANRGAHDVGAKSIGLTISLPMEEKPNPYVTPELAFHFHYFAIRKMHFLIRAKALVVFPGGFGTMDELFETLTLLQTKKIKQLPVFLVGREFWNRVVNFEALVEDGVINATDLLLFQFVDTAEEVVAGIERFYAQEPT